MKKIRGLVAATFTPMDQHGNVDLASIPGMVEKLLKTSLGGLYVCGSTGEGPSLTTSERASVAEAFAGAVQGRVPVIVQVGHNSIEDARRLAAHAAKIGADAISAVPPSYFKPDSMKVLIDTLGKITEAAPETPFYYYHIPRLSGIPMDMLVFLKEAASRLPSLAGIKFSSQDADSMQRCWLLDEHRYNILFGVDEMLLSGLAAGCDGAVGSTYNFMAPLYHEVIHHFENGNLDAARSAQWKAAELIQVIIRRHGVSGLKEAMGFSGIPCGPPRLPLPTLTEEERVQMRAELEALGFLDYAHGQGG